MNLSAHPYWQSLTLRQQVRICATVVKRLNRLVRRLEASTRRNMRMAGL